MANYDILIWVCIAAVAIIGSLFVGQVVPQSWSIFGISITIGVILFLISVKINRSSMTIMFVLLDNTKRRILENLENEKTVDQIAMALNMTSDSEKSTISTNLAYLVKRKFVTKKEEHGVKKYIRNL